MSVSRVSDRFLLSIRQFARELQDKFFFLNSPAQFLVRNINLRFPVNVRLMFVLKKTRGKVQCACDIPTYDR